MEDNFEDMSNDLLRLKLLEYGFSNMPVTSTTRKVLIKKLRNHIAESTAKVRRETMHITKYSSDEDTEQLAASSGAKKNQTKKELTNRRATIAGSAAKLPKLTSSTQQMSKKEPVTSHSVEPPIVRESDTSKRRSGRVTPVKGKGTADLKTAVPPQEAVIMEDSDDDMIPLTQLKQRDRKSKSPSLSRADMLTTSYIHQMEVSERPQKETIVEEMEIDLPDPAREEQVIETIVLDDYDDVGQSSMPPPPQPTALKAPANEPVYSKTTSQLKSQKTIAVSEQQEKSVSGSASVRYGYAAESRAPQTITTPARSSVSGSHLYATKPDYAPSDSPYLSEFTKRLSLARSQAAQISGGIGARDSPSRRTTKDRVSIDRSVPTRSTYGLIDDNVASSSRLRALSRYAQFSTQNMPSQSSAGDIRASLRQTLLNLDHKYSIKKKFYCVLIFLVVIFLFVFFFM